MPDDLFTSTETITDPADTTSAELTPDDLRALAGFHHHLDRVNARDAYARPADRPREAPEDSTYIGRILERIEPWHELSTPPTVVAARAALDAAIAADQAARAEFAQLPHREAAEREAMVRPRWRARRFPS
jgi:hypothetical protein